VTYAVKEIFYSLQGEGVNTGRPAVFCRFSGCNLWTGREKDRATAICNFCDTDFVGIGPDGGKFESAAMLADAVSERWPEDSAVPHRRFVICTGGEPLLQLDEELIDAFHAKGFEIAVETNGTLPVPDGVDWICVSPKSDAPLVQRTGHELKLVFPQEKLQPAHLEMLKFDYFFLQPMDGPFLERNTKEAMEYCLAHPRWRLSLQTHKMLGIR
jgi:7-carboxy-7-deazaguanine synthase